MFSFRLSKQQHQWEFYDRNGNPLSVAEKTLRVSVYSNDYAATNIATITSVSVLSSNTNIARATSQKPLTSLKRVCRYKLWNVTDGAVLSEGYYVVMDGLQAMSSSSASLSQTSSSSSASSSSSDSLDAIYVPLTQDIRVSRGTTPLLSFSPVDRAGTAVNLVGHTLKLIAYSPGYRLNGDFVIRSSSFIITSTKAQVRLTTVHTATARNLSYILWDMNENRAVTYGRLLVEELI